MQAWKLTMNNIKNTNNLLYEVHITVAKDCSLDNLKHALRGSGTKPILIEFDKEIDHQLMTSYHARGDIDSVWLYCTNMQNRLKKLKINIDRVKIEFEPLSAGMESVDGDMNYYESHIECNILNETDEKMLDEICAMYNIHKSVNGFKFKNGIKAKMATLRMYNVTLTQFNKKLDNVLNCIAGHKLKICKKPNVEVCVYDSNVNLDDRWLNK